jgi:hypothetical protein
MSSANTINEGILVNEQVDYVTPTSGSKNTEWCYLCKLVKKAQFKKSKKNLKNLNSVELEEILIEELPMFEIEDLEWPTHKMQVEPDGPTEGPCQQQ